MSFNNVIAIFETWTSSDIMFYLSIPYFTQTEISVEGVALYVINSINYVALNKFSYAKKDMLEMISVELILPW